LKKKQEVEEGIVRALKMESDPTIADDVIMIMVASDLDRLVQWNKKDIIHFSMGFFRLFRLKTGSDNGVCLAGPFLGAPQAVMGMEKLIAMGAKRIWITGWCGSLNPALHIGDLVVPTQAISEEGTSAHYPVSTGPQTDPELNVLLENRLKKGGHPFQMGLLWTTDAPYRETPTKIKAYQGLGALAVEMEMSALITVSTFRHIQLAGLLVVSDELFDLRWNPGFSDPRRKQGSRFACELLIDLIKSFHE
jgi:uridine phosphorylase